MPPLRPSSLSRTAYLYDDVAKTLRRRISDGVYEAGSKLPSVSEFGSEFGVSAITIRHALRELAQSGLIVGHQGLGTFVKNRECIHRVLAGSPETSIADEIMRAGFTARLEELSFGEISVDADMAQLLGVAPDTLICRHEKLTRADEEPVALHQVFLQRSLARRLRNDLGKDFLFRLLTRNGIKVANMRCEFGALAATDEQARLLRLPVGYPLLRVRYSPLNPQGKTILIGTTIARSDRFLFEIDLPQKADG
jgi:GntR family transcriptional regulator